MKNILITGASSGIGAALAEAYAAPDSRLVLIGRDDQRLETVAQSCEEKGATVIRALTDVRNRDSLSISLQEWDRVHPFDLVIANAGISGGIGASGGEGAQQVRDIFSINIDGALNTILPLIPRMKERGRGQIALMSSLAGFRGMPQAPAYCASKATLRVYGEALRGELAPFGVKVNVICPGFVRSRITDANGFYMPFFMEAPAAARVIQKGLKNNRARIAFPFPMYMMAWLLSLFPPGMTDLLLRYAPRKKEAGS